MKVFANAERFKLWISKLIESIRVRQFFSRIAPQSDLMTRESFEFATDSLHILSRWLEWNSNGYTMLVVLAPGTADGSNGYEIGM